MASPYRLKTALPEDLLRVHTCVWREGLSELGEATLTLLSERKDIQAVDLLGKPAALSIAQRADAPRHLSGYVTRFAQVGFEGRYCVYEMSLKPWLWLLTRTADCRVFQRQSVPEIVKKVFEDHPVARFEFKLLRPYRPWRYCVQYRETDFNFIARLLEHEGIYWYLEHDDKGHKLVLCDSASGHDPAPGCESLPFYGGASQVPPQLEHVERWGSVQCLKPGKVAITSYDFERPSTSLLAQQNQTRDYNLSDGEIFDYPGVYTKSADGAQYAEDRLDEIQSGVDLFDASTNAQGVATGHLLTLTRHPRDDQNAQYLVTATTLQLSQATSESGSGESSLRCSFSCMPAKQQYRPARHAQAHGAGAADRHRHRAAGRGDLHRQVRPGEGAVPLGPARPARRRDLLLGQRGASLGGLQLRRRAHPAHRPGGDRRLHGGRPRHADHHRAHLQRREHAALGAAGQRHAERLPDPLQQGWGLRQRQRDPLRGQAGGGAAVDPCREGPAHRGRARRRQVGGQRPAQDHRPA
nr:type VI secretion system tip protein TssI/VgrG [Roseateles sp. DAIF2]